MAGRSCQNSRSTKTQGALTPKVRFRLFYIARRHTLCTPPRARERACVCFPEPTTHQNRGVFSPILIPGAGRVRGLCLGALAARPYPVSFLPFFCAATWNFHPPTPSHLFLCLYHPRTANSTHLRASESTRGFSTCTNSRHRARAVRSKRDGTSR